MVACFSQIGYEIGPEQTVSTKRCFTIRKTLGGETKYFLSCLFSIYMMFAFFFPKTVTKISLTPRFV